jgi:hypothetical protein
MSVKVGDLVGLYRRKTPGMGIILEKMEDVLNGSGIDRAVAFDVAQNAEGRTSWEKHNLVKQLCGSAIGNTEFLGLFFRYNESWCKKPKTSFVKIKWFRQPGSYASRIIDSEGWYPADWVKNK